MTAGRSAIASPDPRDIMAILRYPAQSPALTMLIALSLSMLLTIAPLVGILVQLIVWAAAYHYAVEVFERSANGSATAPEFASGSGSIGWTLLILQLFFSACLWWLDARVETAALRWLGILAIASLQPAITMTTAMNRNIEPALHPRRLLRVIARLGAAYALLVAGGVVLGALQHAVGSVIAGGRTYIVVIVSGISLGDAQQVQGALFGNWLFALLGQMLAGFVLFYAIVMYFHALGATVFAHADALEFVPTPETKLRPEDRHAPLLKRVDALIADSDHASAARTLGECLASEPHTSPEMHARYRELLAKIGDDASLLAHAKSRISALLVAGDERGALGLLRDALDRDPQFRPSAAVETTRLARAADRLGQHELALSLLRDFQLRNPRDPEIAPNAMIAARLLVERHADIAGARAVLDAAADRCLDQAMLDEVLRQIAQLDALAGRLEPPPLAPENPPPSEPIPGGQAGTSDRSGIP